MITKENKTSQTSSDSETKTKSALLEKYEKQNAEANQKEVDGYERLKKKESNKLPRPTGWRLVVCHLKCQKKLKVDYILDKIY